MPRKQNCSGDHYNDPFPSNFRSLIEETTIAGRKIRQEDLTDVLGVKSRQSITGYLDGSTSPSPEQLINLSRFFDVSIDFLLGVSPRENRTRDEVLKLVSERTGLGNNSVAFLFDLSEESKKKPGGEATDILRAINVLLDGNKEETRKYWKRTQAFLFEDEGRYNLKTKHGNFDNVSSDIVLRALLELNNEYLRAEKNRLEREMKEEDNGKHKA